LPGVHVSPQGPQDKWFSDNHELQGQVSRLPYVHINMPERLIIMLPLLLAATSIQGVRKGRPYGRKSRHPQRQAQGPPLSFNWCAFIRQKCVNLFSLC